GRGGAGKVADDMEARDHANGLGHAPLDGLERVVKTLVQEAAQLDELLPGRPQHGMPLQKVLDLGRLLAPFLGGPEQVRLKLVEILKRHGSRSTGETGFSRFRGTPSGRGADAGKPRSGRYRGTPRPRRSPAHRACEAAR